jgi:hypothetical protein
MAPERPELVWVQRSICQRLKCGAAQSIENHLRTRVTITYTSY